MELVNAHKPTTEQDLVHLLEIHVAPCSSCAARVVNGGLHHWALTLHAAAQHARQPHTLLQCQQFVYDLFVRGPLRGRATEMAALAVLRQYGHSWPALSFQESLPDTDSRFAVDIIMFHDHQAVAGIQVKPMSYHHQTEAHDRNVLKNKLWGLPVVYLYYTRTGDWENLDFVIEFLFTI